MIIASTADIDSLDFSRNGNDLIPVVAQNAVTGEVLMVAYADRAAVERTLNTGELWLYSRSRGEPWHKGATSGNTMAVVALHADCDNDALVALVRPAGPACHTGDRTCFAASPTLSALADTIVARAADTSTSSYTRRLLDNPNLRAKKIGEEAVELVLACAAGDAAGAAEEGADLLYHALVACHAAGATLEDVVGVLERRSERFAPAQDETVDQQQHDRAQDGDPE